MTELVDPLKFRSFGVKKTIDEKQDKINQLLDQNKRYYPTDVKGNVDEWGAVMKRQQENYEREQQEQVMHQRKQIEIYGQHLEKELQGREQIKRVDMQIKNSEAERTVQEHKQWESIENTQKEEEKSRMMEVGRLLKSEMENKIKATLEKQILEKIQDSRDIQNAKRQHEQMLAADAAKKQQFKQLLSQNLEDSRKMKNVKDQQDRQQQTVANQNFTKFNYFQGHDTRIAEYKNRFNKFNDFQKYVHESFNEAIVQPQTRKFIRQLDTMTKDEQELNQKYLQDADKDQQYRQIQKEAYKNTLQNQLQQRTIQQQQEKMNTEAINTSIQIGSEGKYEKKDEQRKYKDLLDQQMQLRQNLKMNGNMTNVEKQFNKDELVAYKNYDNNHYSLVPGISPIKKIAERSRSGMGEDPSTVRAALTFDKYNQHQDRLKQHGFTRDVRHAHQNPQQQQQQQYYAKSLDRNGNVDMDGGSRSALEQYATGVNLAIQDNQQQHQQQQNLSFDFGSTKQSHTMKNSFDLSNQYANNNQPQVNASLDNQQVNVYLNGSGRNSPVLATTNKTSPYQSISYSGINVNPIYMQPAGISTGVKERSPQPCGSQKNARTNTILQTAANSILR